MSDNIFDMATEHLLAPAGIEHSDLERLLGNMLTPSIDYADLYFQTVHHESWVLEDGIVKNASYNIDQGVGVRANSGEKTGLAYSDDLILPALEQATVAARSIAKSGKQGVVSAWQRPDKQQLYLPENPLDSLSCEAKIALLSEVDTLARQQDSAVHQVIASLGGIYEIVMVMASDGTMAADIRPLVRLNVTVCVEKNGKREQATCGGGGRYSYQQFLDQGLAAEFSKEAVRQAMLNLDAVPAPAGSMPVVLGPGWPGVLLHEAVGHGLEGDFNRKGSSAFSGRVGEQVASPLCTVVDNGTMEGRRGSLNIDDEGTTTQCTTLIENGVLKGYMQDKLNARLMGVAATGNGRRESYSQMPMPRMTNTYMLPGEHAPEDIIASVDKGIYAVNFGGGQVDITSGKFVFSASEAYLIEKGQVTKPVKGATLIGNGPQVMTKISMVGNDLALDRGVGICGKDGQSVPVGVGQPTLKIDEITVGGTED